MAMLSITLIKSTNSAKKPHVATIQALGLTKIGQTIRQQDNPATRGMLRKVAHLVRFQEE
ncbi:MAG TPA: 50S ribosomal protein L30 [Clostridia bacterium]